MSDRSKKAVDCFNTGFNCSQAVLSTLGPELGLERETALRVAGMFGGGMNQGEVCGAVSGAFMAIGLTYSKTRDGDEEKRDTGYRLTQEFVDQFCARNGSILCRELIGCDISTPEGLAKARETDAFAVCPKLVEHAVEILEQVEGVLE